YLAFAHRAALVDAVADGDGPIGQALFSAGGWPATPLPDLAIVWSAAYEALAGRLAELGVRSIVAAPPRSADARHQARFLLDCLGPRGVRRPLHAAPAPPAGPPPAFLEQVPLTLRDASALANPAVPPTSMTTPDHSRRVCAIRPQSEVGASSPLVLLHPGA